MGPDFHAQVTSATAANTLLPWVKAMSARRLPITAFGLMMGAAVIAGPVQSLLQAPGVEAVVNARVVTLRAPIDGEVQAGPNQLDSGTSIERGAVLFRLANPHTDHSGVDQLTREIERLTSERRGIEGRLANARTQLDNLTEQKRLFVEARVLQLRARKDELTAELAAAQARSVEAQTSLNRYSALAAKGWLPSAQLNQAQRDGSVAEGVVTAAEKRLEAVSVELSAAELGVFVGGSNGERPNYLQHVDQVEQQVRDLTGTLAEHDRQLARASDELTKEKVRYDVLAASDVIAPAKGKVWEILTTPEEQVHRGTELLRVLDCDQLLVTAVIDGALAQRLRISSTVRFRPSDGPGDLPGTVVRINEAPAWPKHLAVQPSEPTSGNFHVTVSVPKLAAGAGCMVGRKGRLVFDASPTVVATASQ